MAHDIFPLQFGRGLNLVAAPEAMGDAQCRVLENMRTLGTGRVTTRKAPLRFASLDQPVLAIEPYTGIPGVAAIALTFQEGGESDVGGVVNLWTINAYGAAELIDSLAGWEAVYSSVLPHMAVVNSIVFICDEDREFGLTIWDPNFFLGAENELLQPVAFFQPTFVFSEVVSESGAGESAVLIGESGESHFSPMPAYPNFLEAHENHLWMFGYGDELDPDRPEYARFSYLGLVADAQGSGDAGLAGRTGSTNLFDVEDVVPICERGQRVVGASSAPGRMVVCSDNVPFAIYGQDRDSWRKDKLDSQRGLVNSLAIGEGDGATIWASPLGFCSFRGGQIQDITEMDDGGSVRPLLEEMDLESVIFGHAFDERHNRFFYRRKDDTLPGCDRAVIVDYRANTLLTDRYKFKDGSRITCVGLIRPSGLEKAASQPISITHTRIGAHTATAVWEPGDPMPGVRTTVRLIGPDGTRVVATLEGGSSQFVHTGLTPSTAYATEIEEVRNGSGLGPIRGDFTTLADTEVLGVENERLMQSAYLGQSAKLQPQLFPMLDVLWDLAEGGLTVIVERGASETGTFTELARLKGESIYHDKDVIAGVRYFYRLKALDASGNTNGYTAVFNEIVTTVTPRTGIGSGLPGEGASEGFDEG